ncbi:MAG: hypothetical protein NDJ75_09040, partial [Thermoanaerobaculia bacterium]|nr:hypothetical protein [Thermoanaerobaculia bacterium]
MLAKLLPGLVAPLFFVVAGAGLLACAPRPLERSYVARLGWAYLLGMAWLTLSAWAAGFLFDVPVDRRLFAVSAATAVVAGLAAIVARRELGGWSRGGDSTRRGRWAARLAAAVVAAAAVALLADASADPVADFDGRMTWGTAARYVQSDRSVLPEVLLDADAYVIHPRYPLTLPLAQVAASELAAAPLESFAVRPLYVLLLPALLAALWPTLVRAGGREAAALAVALVFLGPALLWNADGGPRGTYSDFPLAALLGAGVAALLHPAARRQPWRGPFAGLLLAAALGAKNEGLLLVPAALVAVAAAQRGRRGRRALVGAAAVAAAAALLVVVWRAAIPNRNDEGYFEAFSARAVLAGLPERAPAVLAEMARVSFDPAQWGWTFWVLPALLVAGRRGLRRRAPQAAALCVA